MTNKERVITRAVSKVNSKYYWNNYGMSAPGILLWVYGDLAPSKIGRSAETAICCFDFVLLCAIEEKLINKKKCQEIYTQITKDKGDIRKAMTSKSNWPLLGNWVWRDWPNPFWLPTQKWRPRTGDVVTIGGSDGGNHVVISCGPGSDGFVEVVSFGEGLREPAQVSVNKFSIASIKARIPTINSVKFFDPIWA
jgi:hypothetical protein